MSDELHSGAQTPVNDSSILSKEDVEQSKIPDEQQIRDELPVLPEKKASDYVLVSMFCFLVAFGGFVFGFDTGTISGFVNMGDFVKRFGTHHADGLTLEEVDELYAQGVLPWKSSSWVPPSTEQMATTTGYAAESKPENEHV
ncbi:hypothetical protein QCA50_012252 [Cerrena zonata]|uniref:Major facilitator superfamily (MFS) profile domain-containing protein n=1 Tax=Cerrena zonata TaxID=2478898 RepID=A0AAW0G2Q5_9APHY